MKRIEKPWGFYIDLYERKNKKVKFLFMDRRSSFSYKSHIHRNESWIVMRGEGILTLNDLEKILYEEDVIKINANDKHKLKTDLSTIEILEIQTGNYLSEKDVIRYDDDYGRNTLFKNYKNGT